MQHFLAVLIDAVNYASWLFIIASGLTLIYGVMRILNMAHGSLYALGALIWLIPDRRIEKVLKNAD